MITLYKSKIINKKTVCLKVGQMIQIRMIIVQDKKLKKYTFVGRCIAYHKCGLNSFITLRNIFNKVGVEHSFLIYSPALISLKVLNQPLKTKRKAKLYYLK